MECKHLEEVKMSYVKHLVHAWSMAAALFIHGAFPWLLKDYASNKINATKENCCKL